MFDGEVMIFEMGLYEARLPGNLRYSETHFWFRTNGGRTRCGLTSYAVRLLGELYKIDWQIKPGRQVADAECLGEIESTKATSELYAPMSGIVTAINENAVEDPLAIADDMYETWLFEFDRAPQTSLDVEAYHRFLAAGWEETQMLLKGQLCANGPS